MNNEELQLVVLDILKDWHADGEMYWEHYEGLIDEINLRAAVLLTEKQVRGILYSLKDAGMVETAPIWDGESRLCGKGWFYKKNNTIEQLKNIGEEKWRNRMSMAALNQLHKEMKKKSIPLTSKAYVLLSPTEK